MAQHRIARLFFCGSIPIGRLLEHDGGTFYLQFDGYGLPVPTIEAADAELARLLGGKPSCPAAMMMQPPYADQAYSVSFKAVGLLELAALPAP